jgi:hypothetical protein
MSSRYSSTNRNEISHYVSIGGSPKEKNEDKRYIKVTKYKPIIKRINIDLETEDDDFDDSL